MTGKSRKTLLVVVKLVIAILLMGYVLGKVHWSDYVRDKAGREYAVRSVEPLAEAPARVLVVQGRFWRQTTQWMAASDFEPIDDKHNVIIRTGFASAILNINKLYLLAATGGFLTSIFIIACRWWLLLRLQSIHIRLWEAIRLTFLGQFFNIVVPGTVGGDLVKAYYVSRHTTRKAAVLISVLIDRVMGMIELVALATVMVSVVWLGNLEGRDQIRTPAITLVITICVVVAGVAFLFSQRLRQAMHLQKFYSHLSFASHINAAGEALVLYRKRLPQLFQAIAVTFGAHVIWVGSVAMLGKSLDLEVPLYSYFTYIPLIYIIGAVPLTPGGIGLIEQFYLVFFHANPSKVLALAMLARLVPVFWSLPGAVVAVTGPKLPNADQMKAQLDIKE